MDLCLSCIHGKTCPERADMIDVAGRLHIIFDVTECDGHMEDLRNTICFQCQMLAKGNTPSCDTCMNGPTPFNVLTHLEKQLEEKRGKVTDLKNDLTDVIAERGELQDQLSREREEKEEAKATYEKVCNTTIKALEDRAEELFRHSRENAEGITSLRRKNKALEEKVKYYTDEWRTATEIVPTIVKKYKTSVVEIKLLLHYFGRLTLLGYDFDNLMKLWPDPLDPDHPHKEPVEHIKIDPNDLAEHFRKKGIDAEVLGHPIDIKLRDIRMHPEPKKGEEKVHRLEFIVKPVEEMINDLVRKLQEQNLLPKGNWEIIWTPISLEPDPPKEPSEDKGEDDK